MTLYLERGLDMVKNLATIPLILVLLTFGSPQAHATLAPVGTEK